MLSATPRERIIMPRCLLQTAVVVGTLCFAMSGETEIRAATVYNLAREAKASATSEHNASYLAKFAIDGQIPPAGSKADLDRHAQ